MLRLNRHKRLRMAKILAGRGAMAYEDNLIRQILLGNNEMFEQIVLKYQNLVYTICLNIVGNGHDAENMAQESFLAAYRALKSFQGGNFKSWLCRIAVTKSIDYKRKQSKAEVSDIARFESLANGGDSVEELILLKERKEKMEIILAEIPNKYSSVIRAFYYDRFPVKEISRRMDLPEKTVETQLYRARKIIRKKWGEDGI